MALIWSKEPLMEIQVESEELAVKTAQKRWTIRRKREVVLRLLRGESLDTGKKDEFLARARRSKR